MLEKGEIREEYFQTKAYLLTLIWTRFLQLLYCELNMMLTVHYYTNPNATEDSIKILQKTKRKKDPFGWYFSRQFFGWAYDPT